MNSDLMSFAALAPAYPELLLAVGAVVLLLAGVVFSRERSSGLAFLSIILLVAVIAVAIWQPAEGVLFNGGFIVDGFARYMKFLVLGGSAFTLILSTSTAKPFGLDKFEYAILVLLATLGMMVMVSANDLITLYLGLELQSLALYVVASFDRDSVRSTEAGLKYFVLGALASGMLLYGASLVYGFTGTVSFEGIATALHGAAPGLGIILGIVFVAAGIAFKISAAPFHMWTPDVYEGAPTPVTAFFASAPKMAAMALMVRVFVGAFPGILAQWQQIIVFISIISMTLGAFAAIGQRNFKRLMAYSSIGNVGYALIGLAAGTPAGVQGVVVYMAIYLAMTLGAFACILAMRRGEVMIEDIDELSGAARTHPVMAFCLAMMMFSLAGVPPLAGFFAKFYVFGAAIEARLVTLAVIGVVTSVVGAYYYVRIVKIMYFDEPRAAFEPMTPALKVVLGLASAVILLFWIVPAPLVGAAAAAARSLF